MYLTDACYCWEMHQNVFGPVTGKTRYTPPRIQISWNLVRSTRRRLPRPKFIETIMKNKPQWYTNNLRQMFC